MGVNLSPNMSLPIPQVGNEPGPEYAIDVNACLTLLDQHDHTPGYGTAITPLGLNINDDLSIGSNNLTLVRSLRFSPQVSPLPGLSPDLGAIYVAGVDLYYNDVSGNQIRLTQAGSIVGTAGSITGLVPPASASYGSNTFVWQSDSLTPANMDAASYIFRNLSPSSFGLTLQPPLAMTFDYSITLPTLPLAAKVVSISPTGVLATGVADTVVTNDITNLNVTEAKLAADSVSTSKIVNEAVTQEKHAIRTAGNPVGTGGVARSGSSGSFSTASATYVGITNLEVTIDVLGSPVFITCTPDSALPASFSPFGVAGGARLDVRLLRNGAPVAEFRMATLASGSTTTSIHIPPGCMTHVDTPTAGTVTYTLQMKLVTGTTAEALNMRLVAYEL